MKYICSICGYVYDEAKEKSSFSDLPADWTCPLCGAPKSDFVLEEGRPTADAASTDRVAPASTAAVDAAPADAAKRASASYSPDSPEKTSAPDSELQKLSAGQLAALCSNLAQGCEKQYLHKESELFKQLADYFGSRTPAVEDATVLSLAENLKKEVDGYALHHDTAKAAADRGAQRVGVWGEKVTKMLSSLMERYLKDGEAMLEGKEVWVCSACGFVYIGREAPELCPVCKVPSWKFEKIERR